jgi:hypothetical protein
MILSAPPPVMPAPIPATVAPPPISAPFEAAGEHHLRETLGLPSIDGRSVIWRIQKDQLGLEPLENGLMGTLLRYPYEVRDEKEYFDDIQDVKVTKDIQAAEPILFHSVNEVGCGPRPQPRSEHEIVRRWGAVCSDTLFDVMDPDALGQSA